ncbi:MAG TPA: MBL fold metallo-hydrolase [Allosphingosinicella sp.]|nr:MBL fold metallo-hydrolase [Allosphingosinicella sp.]
MKARIWSASLALALLPLAIAAAPTVARSMQPPPPPPTAAAIAADRMVVHYLDVDQGNAALLEFPCGAILIDAGGRGPAAGNHLIDYLDAFFARRTDLHRLDAVFITHTHIDHNSNLRRVAQRYRIGGYIHNGKLTGSGSPNANWMHNNAATLPSPVTDRAVQDLTGTAGREGPVIDPLACPRVDPRIRVLSGGLTSNPGWTATDYNNGNNHSLVIRVDYGRASFLFTGDLENAGIARLLAQYAGTRALNTDVYEVGHHGSYNGTTAPLLAAMSPEIAVISVGPSTVQAPWTAYAYGHPRRTLVTLLDGTISRHRAAPVSVMVADGARHFSAYALTDAIYATGWDGDVTITAAASGALQVETTH